MKTAMVGKLHIESTTPANGRFYLNDDSSVTVAEVIATETGLQLARLFAAAPDGYALAKRLLDYFPKGEIDPRLDCDIEIRQMARELIAKAEGRQ